MKTPRIAIVYDRLNSFGGAEQVLLALHEAFPDAPLYTSVWSKRKTAWLGDWEVRTSFLQYLPIAREHHQWFGWLMPMVFESFDFSAFDIIISVTSEAAKGIVTSASQLHICYCLTPTRYLWSHTHEYEGSHWRWLKRLVFHELRFWDVMASQRPDIIIPISHIVKARIEKYYRRSTEAVVYPPVNVPTQPAVQAREVGQYFLVVSRLVRYKRIDLVIQACVEQELPLVIVGTGEDEARLKKIAGGNRLITFLGFVDQQKFDMIYSRAWAVVMAQEEDFGIVSVEAQLAGVPVISYAKSGVRETVIEGKTGILFPEQTIASLSTALRQARAIVWDPRLITDHAHTFSVTRFILAWRSIVQDALERRGQHSVL